MLQHDEEGALAVIEQLRLLNDKEAKAGHFYRLVDLIDASQGGRPKQLAQPSDASAAPEQIAGLGSYPNPFNPVSRVQYRVTEPGDVRVEVYNINGQRVAVLANGPKQAGQHTATFDGSALASGVYLVRMQLAGRVYTHKMVLVK